MAQTSQHRQDLTMGPMLVIPIVIQLVIQLAIQLTPMVQSSVALMAQTWGLCWVRYWFRSAPMLVQWTATRMICSLEWQ